MNTTANKLKSLREAKGMSQADCAKALGIDRTTYAKYENGGSVKRNVEKLATFFNVSTDYLLGNEYFRNPDGTPWSPWGDGFPDSTPPATHSKNDAPPSTLLPALTPKDEREISRDLENMIESLSGAAAMGDSEDDEDMEMLKASLKQAMVLSKRIAKKKFTPIKYR